ncbi:hypothetical protein EKD04_017210 [Chloroflexales bacterium ZM16-3]|nr:hypothetical protein [Chloroflexales bacterium ZM16-3]
MTQTALRDLLIFLPGIMGSSLRLDNVDLWAVSGQSVWQFFKTAPKLGKRLQKLKLRDDDYQKSDLGDGISVGEVIMGDALVAPLLSMGGYRPIITRIAHDFDGVVTGSVHAPRDEANFFPFPYDWRRDNRASALRLKMFIDRQLPRWREHSGAKDAKVVLIAHSMGGLVSRYYLEALDGWSDCRLLLTIATPHRGSLNAVDTLSNGITLFPSLTRVIRDLTSIYQLLPIYEAITVGGAQTRVAETNALPGIDQSWAKAAREDFHLEIYRRAKENRAMGRSQLTIPWVGVHQDTFQSAFVEDGRVMMSYHLPPIIDMAFDGGDGTVPRVSAVPADFSKQEEELSRYSAQQHGWITNNEMTLTPLIESLHTILSPGSQNVLGRESDRKPAINLRADSVFGPGQPIVLSLAVEKTEHTLTLEARLESTTPSAKTITSKIDVKPGERMSLSFTDVPPGLYRVAVRSRGFKGLAPDPVQSLVELVDATAVEAMDS